MKKVLLTGGAGYIGSHICLELVQHGYMPVIVDNFSASDRRIIERTQRLAGSAFPVHELDCRNTPRLRALLEQEEEIIGVIHLAAHKSVGVSVKHPRDYYDNNVGALLSLLAALETTCIERLVFSSSCTVYGQPKRVPVTEESPIARAESPYGRTKQMCEAILDDVVAASPLQVVTLRYFNPVGAHPSGLIGELPLGKPETLVPYITQTAAGQRTELVVFGSDYPTRDGTCVRDYLHVVDLASAHVAALAWLERRGGAAFNEIFNLGTGRGVSVLEAIAAFEQAAETKLDYRFGPRRPGDVIEVYADAEKARRELNWHARFGILDAMRDAWRWQRNIARGL